MEVLIASDFWTFIDVCVFCILCYLCLVIVFFIFFFYNWSDEWTSEFGKGNLGTPKLSFMSINYHNIFKYDNLFAKFHLYH